MESYKEALKNHLDRMEANNPYNNCMGCLGLQNSEKLYKQIMDDIKEFNKTMKHLDEFNKMLKFIKKYSKPVPGIERRSEETWIEPETHIHDIR